MVGSSTSRPGRARRHGGGFTGSPREPVLRLVLGVLHAARTVRLDAFKDLTCWDAFRSVGEIFLVPWRYLFTKPAFDGRTPPLNLYWLAENALTLSLVCSHLLSS